jgi:hypothetical protein
MHWLRPTGSESRNSDPDAKVSTENPAVATRRRNARRTERSSSMIETSIMRLAIVNPFEG